MRARAFRTCICMCWGSARSRGLRASYFFTMTGVPERRGVKKALGHSVGQADTTVRGRMRRNVTFMHGVAALEKHGEGHARAVEMRPGRTAILAGVDIRFRDIAEAVHVIAETESRYDPCFSRPPDNGPAESKTRACRWKRSIRRQPFFP